jgi:hypothetical protein
MEIKRKKSGIENLSMMEMEQGRRERGRGEGFSGWKGVNKHKKVLITIGILSSIHILHP